MRASATGDDLFTVQILPPGLSVDSIIPERHMRGIRIAFSGGCFVARAVVQFAAYAFASTASDHDVRYAKAIAAAMSESSRLNGRPLGMRPPNAVQALQATGGPRERFEVGVGFVEALETRPPVPCRADVTKVPSWRRCRCGRWRA